MNIGRSTNEEIWKSEGRSLPTHLNSREDSVESVVNFVKCCYEMLYVTRLIFQIYACQKCQIA